MSVPHLLADAAVAIKPSAGYGMTAARLEASITALVGLGGIVTGGLALRSTGRNRSVGRTPVVALLAGLISTVLGVVLSATAKGGPGTGNGIVGAWLAIAFGLIGIILGGLALARSRRTSHHAESTPMS